MGKNELKNRDNWQTESGKFAEQAELSFYDVFTYHFENTPYRLYKQPKHLQNLYSLVDLPQSVINKIYNPQIDFSHVHWGVKSDFAIENTMTHKIIFGEIKRQDGWVEGKEPSAGRGNAHERLCKLFTPGLLKAYRKVSLITDCDFLPFWVIFEGDITRDPKRVREITFWFDKYDKNYFFWRNSQSEELIYHFEMFIKPHLS